MDRIVQDAQVVFTADQLEKQKAEYKAAGYVVKTQGFSGGGWLVTAYEKEEK